MKSQEILKNLIDRYPILLDCEDSIYEAYELLIKTFESGNKLLIAGNGGSASDSNHIVGELMKSFELKRDIDPIIIDKLKIDKKYGTDLINSLQGALPAISLNNHDSLNTAFLNDVNPYITFAQQVYGYGKENDVFWGISTSGNSKNIVMAALVAKAKNMKVIGLTGEKESDLSNIADITIKVPEKRTYKVQELHLPVYHCLCLMLEEYFFGKNK